MAEDWELVGRNGVLVTPDEANRIAYVELYVALSGSITASPSTAEVGSTVNDVTLAWSYNKDVTSQSINQGVGVLQAAVRSTDLSALGLQSDRTWTLTASDGTNTITPTASVAFRHKRRYGVSATATPNQSLIESLTAEFAASRAQTRVMSASSQYLYFAWPAAFGEPTFTVNGLPVTGWVKTVVSFTNSSGYTTDFWVYRSQYQQNGSNITVVVA